MVGFMIQAESVHRSHGTLLAPLLFLTVVTLGGGLFVAFVGRVLPWARGVVRSRRARWRQQHGTAQIEMRARALMDELCPHGWRAQLTLFPAPPHDPPSESSEAPRSEAPRDQVALDWTAFEHDDSGEPIVRRVWAPTIGQALEAMVADRHTDETLAQIEQGALADGAVWPDS
jgi:hypothetical protein